MAWDTEPIPPAPVPVMLVVRRVHPMGEDPRPDTPPGSMVYWVDYVFPPPNAEPGDMWMPPASNPED